jgi:hypothetical protein
VSVSGRQPDPRFCAARSRAQLTTTERITWEA